METTSVNGCVAFGRLPLDAVIVSGYDPAGPVAGVPESKPPVVSESPDGNVPVVKVGAGEPVPVTLNVVPAVATVKVVVAALVMVGAELRFKVKVVAGNAEKTGFVAHGEPFSTNIKLEAGFGSTLIT